MKRISLLAVAPLMFAATLNPQLKEVRTVYILAMSNGLDQFLANQITASGIFQVVTDPKNADAILTDRVGEAFESKLDELYPPPAPAPAAKAEEAKPNDSKQDKPAADKNKKDQNPDLDLGAGSVFRVSPSSRSKGNLFIVDRKSRNVLWSVFEPPKDNSPNELSKTAERFIKRLKIDLSEKKQPSE